MLIPLCLGGAQQPEPVTDGTEGLRLWRQRREFSLSVQVQSLSLVQPALDGDASGGFSAGLSEAVTSGWPVTLAPSQALGQLPG